MSCVISSPCLGLILCISHFGKSVESLSCSSSGVESFGIKVLISFKSHLVEAAFGKVSNNERRVLYGTVKIAAICRGRSRPTLPDCRHSESSRVIG